jgi:RND family efflux transporter MFP subunit
MFMQQLNLRWRSCAFAAVSCLSISLFLFACSSGREGYSEKETFLVTNPIVSDTTYTSEYVADIHSLQNVELRARVKGYIEKIHVDEGQSVNAGQLLFTISSQEYKQEVIKAKAMLTSAIADAKVAEVDLNNVKILVNKNVVSNSELEMAQAKMDAFQAKIEEAKAHEANAILQLSFTEVRAPFSGVINRIINKAGSLIDEGTLLTTLSDNHEVFAYFNVSETDYLNLVEQGKEDKKYGVELIMANHRPHPHKGVIETVEGEVDKSTGNIAFRARFKNPEFVLKNGATGTIKLDHEIEKAMLIPQKSTFEIQDNLYVYVIDDKNMVQLRSIKPTLRIPHLYVVETGLTTKDRILYEGIQRVKEGDLIEPEALSMKDIIAQLALL